jgi:hypothetical protein
MHSHTRISVSVSDFFDGLLFDLDCHRDTKAYIVSIFGKYKTADFDLSQCSLGIEFVKAREKQNFASYQNIGDWVFFINTLAPQHFHRHASKDYYDNLARLSFYSCYNIVKWNCYEELADNLIVLEDEVRNRLPQL